MRRHRYRWRVKEGRFKALFALSAAWAMPCDLPGPRVSHVAPVCLAIPRPILAQVGLEGTADLQVRDGVIEIRPVRRNPREGWADDARRLAEQGGDALVRPEVANEGDAPMATGSRPAGLRIAVIFQGKQGLIVLDQVRTFDRGRLVKRLGALRPTTLAATLRTLQAMFAA